ncbi:MAG: radical SAM protein [Myxococcota bacterium]
MAKFLTLTDKCNLRCSFCYEISPFGEPHEFEAAPESFAPELYTAFHDEGWRDVVITGGEPTMMPTFFQAVAACVEQGYERIIVASNGRRFAYPSFTRRAKLTGVTHANISLFGHERVIHDGITKVRGSFEQTCEGIRNLVAAGIDVSCSVVVSQRNYEHLTPYMDHVWGLGVRRMLMMGIKPFGGAFTERDRVFYDFEVGAPLVNASIRYGVELGLDITTMGLPSPPFDTTGTTDDNIRALKYFDYVLKRMPHDPPYCHDVLCDNCFGRDVCPDGADQGRLIVCKCVVVREGELREQIRAGKTTVRALRDATNACTECKTCATDLKALIECELQGLPFNPRQLTLPSDTRHGASRSDGLTLQGSWSEDEDSDTEWNVERLPS